MSDLYPTKTRLALLRNVAFERVRREYSGEEHLDFDVWDGRTVIARIAELAGVRWVELDPVLVKTGPHGFQVRYWHLTDAGRAVLDAHGEAS